MKSVFLNKNIFYWSSRLTCLTIIVLIAVFFHPQVNAAPTYTGSVPADFTDSNVVVLDDLVGDVGVPGVLTGVTSGWDVNDIYIQYDYANDVLYVGIDCVVICGDADGNGDPSTTSPELASTGGTDFPNFGSSESFILLLDTEGAFTDASDFDAVVGINSTNSTINDFGIFDFNNNVLPLSAAANFGAALPNPSTLFASPDSSRPDLELTISNFSTLPGFTFNPREAFSFNVYYFNGSVDDDGIGEDSFPGTGAAPVQIAGVAAIGDYVWIDSNANGIQEAGEVPVANVPVSLFDEADNLIATTVTDANGLYIFDELPAGDYYLQFTPPSGFTVTTQDAGADNLDSDVNPATGTTIITNLVEGEFDQTWDLGLYQPASLGDFVWVDQNANGLQEAGEIPVPNVLVTLFDSSNNVVGTTTTDANGLYLFPNLVPGNYYVNFTPPAGFIITPQDTSADNLDSDVNPATGNTIVTNLVSGENDLTWDLGVYQLASIGDFVWVDTNANGIQEAGESPLPGITVSLYNSQNILISTTSTDSNGFYLFDQLVPGDYYIQFDIPDIYEISPVNQGVNDAADSDVNPVTLTTTVTTLISGENDLTWDAGVYSLYTIGDHLWHDTDHDNVQDSQEPPIPGVIVNLIQNGQVISTTTTDSNGNYSFEVLPGSYSINIPQNNFSAGQPLEGLTNTGLGNTRNVTITNSDNFTLDFGYDEPIGEVLGASTNRELAPTGQEIHLNSKTRVILISLSLLILFLLNFSKIINHVSASFTKIKVTYFSYAYKFTLTASLLLLSSIIFLSPVKAAVTFTGNAQTDFAGTGTMTIADTVGDVGMPGSLSGETSGWDVSHVYLQYDPSNDTLYVGINCVVICGDADGDGDPNSTGSTLGGLGGTDQANFGDSESFILLLDTNNNFNGTTGYDVVIGINSDSSTISDFGIFNFSHTTTPWSAAANFGTELSNTASLFATPSSGDPDLEFSIADFSSVPGFTFTPGQSFQFGVYYYNGSLEDDGIGEDSTSGTGNPSLVSVPQNSTSSTSSVSLLPATASDRGKLLSLSILVLTLMVISSTVYLVAYIKRNKVAF